MEFYKAIGLGVGPCAECEKYNLKSCVNRDKSPIYGILWH